MRRALVVGINYYSQINRLFGCVNDAHGVKKMLERNSDSTVNFGVRFMAASGPKDAVSRAQLREAINTLFKGDSDVALLYFAGHGHVDETGGFICSSDSSSGSDGVSLNEVLTLANTSAAKNKIIVLDSCFAGAAGDHSLMPDTAQLSQGLTILTASTKDQYASERSGCGVFTTLFVDALAGSAANLMGNITPGSVYAHIDQSLGPWDQRPVFKTNVKAFISLRKVEPPIPLSDLQRIVEFFPDAGAEYPLDPTYEPVRLGGDAEKGWPPPIEENNRKFAVLQKYNRVNLVVPVDAPHMWHAAVGSKACKLTVLGEHYRRLVEEKRI